MSENKKNRAVRDPLKTKTGKTRLGPLNKEQLEKFIADASKPKIKAKAQRVFDRKYKHLSMAGPVVETAIESTEQKTAEVQESEA
jgi:hypothetical protein